MVQEGALTALASVADSSQVRNSHVCNNGWRNCWIHAFVDHVHVIAGTFPKVL